MILLEKVSLKFNWLLRLTSFQETSSHYLSRIKRELNCALLSQASSLAKESSVDLASGVYSLVNGDTFGDGICCSNGLVGFNITDGHTIWPLPMGCTEPEQSSGLPLVIYFEANGLSIIFKLRHTSGRRNLDRRSLGQFSLDGSRQSGIGFSFDRS